MLRFIRSIVTGICALLMVCSLVLIGLSLRWTPTLSWKRTTADLSADRFNSGHRADHYTLNIARGTVFVCRSDQAGTLVDGPPGIQWDWSLDPTDPTLVNVSKPQPLWSLGSFSWSSFDLYYGYERITLITFPLWAITLAAFLPLALGLFRSVRRRRRRQQPGFPVVPTPPSGA